MSRSLVCPAVVAGVLLTGAIRAAAQQTATEQPRQRNVITAEEIERLTGVEDAYQVVLRLRPEFLRSRARPQLRAAMATERNTRQDLGAPSISNRPSMSVTGTGGGQAPNPDAPEFGNDRVSGRTAARGGGSPSAGTTSGTRPVTTAVGMAPPGAPDGEAEPSRGEESPIAVYVGNMMFGGVEELTRVLAANVREIRYLNPSEAHFRFGPRYDAGVIMVTLK
jgi:hypothetical protein